MRMAIVVEPLHANFSFAINSEKQIRKEPRVALEDRRLLQLGGSHYRISLPLSLSLVEVSALLLLDYEFPYHSIHNAVVPTSFSIEQCEGNY